MAEELISIIIPTYNRSELLEKISVPSVLGQVYKNWELIIIDDGSDDNTPEICEKILELDARIKYLRKENGGQGSARNAGIKMASGDYVLLLDCDDALLPSMVKTMMDKIIETNSDQVRCLKWDFDIRRGVLGISQANPSCVIYRKSLFENLGYYSEERGLIGVEDTDLEISWGKTIKEKKIKAEIELVDEPLVAYLLHEDQATGNKFISRKINYLSVLAEKLDKDSGADAGMASIIYGSLGNYLFISDNRGGRNYLRRSLQIKFSPKVLFFYISTFFGFRLYRIFLAAARCLINGVSAFRVARYRHRFPELYLEFKAILGSYK